MKEMKIGEWLDEWFEVYTGEMADKTIATYRDARRRLNCHFPEIEERRLGELLPKTFQNILNELGHHYSVNRMEPDPRHKNPQVCVAKSGKRLNAGRTEGF